MARELPIGDFSISGNVIASIVTDAAEAVEGVAYVCGRTVASNLVSFFMSRPTVTDDTIECSMEDGKLSINVPIAVFFGYQFPELAKDVRSAIAKALTTQVGCEVGDINIVIDELVFPRES